MCRCVRAWMRGCVRGCVRAYVRVCLGVGVKGWGIIEERYGKNRRVKTKAKMHQEHKPVPQMSTFSEALIDFGLYDMVLQRTTKVC
jgi:hypothetical protein